MSLPIQENQHAFRRTEGSLMGTISSKSLEFLQPSLVESRQIVPKADTAFSFLTFLFRCISWSCKCSLSSMVFSGWDIHLISRGCSSGLDMTFVNPLAYSTPIQGLYNSFHHLMFIFIPKIFILCFTGTAIDQRQPASTIAESSRGSPSSLQRNTGLLLPSSSSVVLHLHWVSDTIPELFK